MELNYHVTSRLLHKLNILQIKLGFLLLLRQLTIKVAVKDAVQCIPQIHCPAEPVPKKIYAITVKSAYLQN